MVKVKHYNLVKFARGYFENKIKEIKVYVDNCLKDVEQNKKNGNPNPYKGLLPLLNDLECKTRSDVTDWDEIDCAYCEDMNVHEKLCVHRVREVVYEDDHPETVELPTLDLAVLDEYAKFMMAIFSYITFAAVMRKDYVSAILVKVYLGEEVTFDNMSYGIDPYTYLNYEYSLDIIEDLLNRDDLFPDAVGKTANMNKILNIIVELDPLNGKYIAEEYVKYNGLEVEE